MESSQDNINELEELKALDIEVSSGMSEDVKHRIINNLFKPENIYQLTEFSMKEIKILVRQRNIARACNDRVRLGVVEDYILFKISKERQGRSKLEDMCMPVSLYPQSPSLKDKIYSKFGKKTNDGR